MIWHNRVLLCLGRHVPWLARVILAGVARGMKKHPERVFGPSFIQALPAADQLALQHPLLRNALSASMREAFRHGVEGPWYDGQLYIRPWGFRCQDIQAKVLISHGEKDVHVPVSLGRWLAAAIPNCQAVFYPEETHLSLPLNRTREIFARLVENR